MRLYSSSLLPAAFLTPNGPVRLSQLSLHPRRCRPSSSQLYGDPSYGLTDDGDFAILGVNAYDNSDDDNSSMGQSVGSVSSILAGVGLSEVTTQSSGPESTNTAVSRNNNMPNFGSTTSSINDAIFGRLDSGSMMGIPDAKRGSVIGENVGERSTDTQQQNQYTRSSDVDETTLFEIQEWLFSIIPALNEQDAESYSRGLDAIGFNPGCVTMCELQIEDLGFMKVLHRRYLFNEVTGNEHPWEV
eukprot:scaffold8609_cov101-Skeletonema_marinoi.AAC.1